MKWWDQIRAPRGAGRLRRTERRMSVKPIERPSKEEPARKIKGSIREFRGES